MIGGSRTLGRRGKPPAPDGSPSRHRGRTDGLRPPPRRVENGKIVSSPCGPGHGKIPSYPRRKYSPSDPGHGKIPFRVFPGPPKILLCLRRVFLLLFSPPPAPACTCCVQIRVIPTFLQSLTTLHVSLDGCFKARPHRLRGLPPPRWGRPPGTSHSSPVLPASAPTLFLE